MSELEWRPLRPGDISAVVDLLAAAERVDRTREHYDRLDLVQEFVDHPADIDRTTVAVLDDGVLIAMGMQHVRAAEAGVLMLELMGAVHPDRRAEGIGRGVLAVQMHQAQEQHARLAPHLPGRVVVRPYDHVVPHVRLVRAVGLEPVRHWFDMQRDLHEPLPAIPEPVPGVDVVDYDSARDDEVRAAYNLAFADGFGTGEQDAEIWTQWFTGSRAFRPDLSALALAEGRVVGLCLSYFYVADAAIDGSSEGWIGQVGTLPEFRGRGIGTHLIARALHAHRAAGLDRTVLDVDGESPITGRGIYVRLGFTVTRKRTSFVRDLEPRPR